MAERCVQDVSAVSEWLNKLTLEEKAALCSGQDFWFSKGIARLGIPALMLTDGPHGLRKQAQAGSVNFNSVPATCFPTAAATANSWDRDLLREIGVALGEECRQEGVAVLLGPGVNIKRSPLCGRNFEYFSEDPLLAGELAAAWIEGVQSQGIGTSLKHFAVNNQEHLRNTINTVVDARTLREIYLAGFERAVKQARPWTVMAAYNRVNGAYCSEHPQLLDGILRGEWGYDGVVVSDWGACNDRMEGLRAGLDLEMPSSGGVNDAEIVAAVRAGRLDGAVLDRAVERLLKLILRAQGHGAANAGYRYDAQAHHRLARRAAAESMVLLRNENDLLPLRPGARIAVIGEFARQPRYQGTGSSQITPLQLEAALDHLAQSADCVYAAGYSAAETPDEALIEAACAAARAAETAVIFAGLPSIYESEGFDRRHLQLPASHIALIERVAAVNPNTVVVLANGAPVTMPWAGRVRAILGTFLAGQAGGGAVADVLFGRVNPSGKLAETYPLRLEDTPAFRYFPGGPETVEYREALYVGYRYYDSAAVPVLFPFGHGLSYTTFDYGEIALSAAIIAETQPLQVTIAVRNTGTVAGAEVVQLYVRPVAPTAYRPAKELKEFAKVWLQPGEERTLAFDLDRRSFAHYDAAAGDWRVEGGDYDILIGASSADIRARATVRIEALAPAGPGAGPSAYRRPAADFVASDADFATLYGGPLPRQSRAEGFHRNSTLGELRRTFIGRQLYRGVLRGSQGLVGDGGDPALVKARDEMVAAMPLRQLVLFSGGRLNFATADALLLMMNGKPVAGLRRLFAALVRWR